MKNKNKNKNKVEQYFEQKSFSIIEIVLLVISVICVFVAIFVQGGIPMGLPVLLVCVVVFCVLRSFKVKDAEIEQILNKIIEDNAIERSENTIECYDLKSTLKKKRNDGKFVSSKYYISNITFSAEATIFNVYSIDLVDKTVEKSSYTVNCNEKINLNEEFVRISGGSVSVAYLEFLSCLIPVTLKDYKTAELVGKICEKHK